MASEQLRGYRLFNFTYRLLTTVRTKGVLRAASFYVAGFALVALAYTWKARQFLHWRLSRKISQRAYDGRDAICRTCPQTVVRDDQRYKNCESRYCGSCGCTENRWAELTVKNTRKGHICPLYRFPEQAEQLKKIEAAKNPGGCKGCGPKKQPTPPADRNGRGLLANWHENSGLLATRGRP